MGIVSRILSISPYVEISFRHLYWKAQSLLPRHKAKALAQSRPTNRKPVDFKAVTDHLAARGAGQGALLVIHSSAAALAATGMNEREIIASLQSLVGEEGTLALACIPVLKGQPTGLEYIFGDPSNLKLTYDVKRSPPWTGLLPFLLMKNPKAVRSRHPLNTLVAVGPLAEPMMAQNLDGDRPLPCGPQSSWAFCHDHGAKIVGLGVDLAQSLTMIHMSEDSHPDEWPIENWYRDRTFTLVDGNASKEIKVRERYPKFALNYGGYALVKDLRREGILHERSFGDVVISIIDAQALLRFLDGRRHTGYPFFFFPWQRRGRASHANHPRV
jgi:aminoglycoside 3-N-acetyltransferase